MHIYIGRESERERERERERESESEFLSFVPGGYMLFYTGRLGSYDYVGTPT